MLRIIWLSPRGSRFLLQARGEGAYARLARLSASASGHHHVANRWRATNALAKFETDTGSESLRGNDMLQSTLCTSTTVEQTQLRVSSLATPFSSRGNTTIVTWAII